MLLPHPWLSRSRQLLPQLRHELLFPRPWEDKFKNTPFGQCPLAPKYRLLADQKIPLTSFQTYLALSFIWASRTFKLFAVPVCKRKKVLWAGVWSKEWFWSDVSEKHFWLSSWFSSCQQKRKMNFLITCQTYSCWKVRKRNWAKAAEQFSRQNQPRLSGSVKQSSLQLLDSSPENSGHPATLLLPWGLTQRPAVEKWALCQYPGTMLHITKHFCLRIKMLQSFP